MWMLFSRGGVDWRRWRLVFVAPLVLVLCVFVAPGVARASGTLDQSQLDHSQGFEEICGNCGYGSGAQTFTAGLTGKLDHVELYVGKTLNPVPTDPLIVEITDTSGGGPDSNVLASASVPPASVPTAGWLEVDFASPAQVTSGTQYAIVLYTLDPGPGNYAWGLSPETNPYSGGEFLINNTSLPPVPPGWFAIESGNTDAAFETYVETVTAGDLAQQLVTDADHLPPGTALPDKAAAIQTAVNANQKATACGDITNFLGLVKAQTGKKLSQANVTLLTNDANNLAAALGC